MTSSVHAGKTASCLKGPKRQMQTMSKRRKEWTERDRDRDRERQRQGQRTTETETKRDRIRETER